MKLSQGRLGKLFLYLFLEIDKFSLYFRIDISLALERSTRQCNDVTIGAALIFTNMLLSFSDTLTYTILIVALGQSVLPRGRLLVVCIHFPLLQLLWTLLATRVMLLLILYVVL